MVSGSRTRSRPRLPVEPDRRPAGEGRRNRRPRGRRGRRLPALAARGVRSAGNLPFWKRRTAVSGSNLPRTPAPLRSRDRAGPSAGDVDLGDRLREATCVVGDEPIGAGIERRRQVDGIGRLQAVLASQDRGGLGDTMIDWRRSRRSSSRPSSSISSARLTLRRGRPEAPPPTPLLGPAPGPSSRKAAGGPWLPCARGGARLPLRSVRNDGAAVDRVGSSRRRPGRSV